LRCGLSVRPEHIHLKARSEDENRISAVVERVEFFGAELMLHCRLDANGRMIAIPIRSDDPAMPGEGDRVELGVSSTRCRVVPDE
jgi:multiple sugar transport system ATP-binding protein